MSPKSEGSGHGGAKKRKKKTRKNEGVRVEPTGDRARARREPTAKAFGGAAHAQQRERAREIRRPNEPSERASAKGEREGSDEEGDGEAGGHEERRRQRGRWWWERLSGLRER